MPLPTGVALLPDEVRAMLLPGERPLSWELASSFAQASAIGGAPRADIGFSPDPVAGGITVNHDWIGAKVGGVSAGGAPGSIASGFERAMSTTGIQNLLLTDRRLAVVETRSGRGLTVEHALTFEIDRRAVRAIALAPRLLQRGRVRIDFADGSWGMAMLGVFRRSAARRLMRAFSPPPAA